MLFDSNVILSSDYWVAKARKSGNRIAAAMLEITSHGLGSVPTQLDLKQGTTGHSGMANIIGMFCGRPRHAVMLLLPA